MPTHGRTTILSMLLLTSCTGAHPAPGSREAQRQQQEEQQEMQRPEHERQRREQELRQKDGGQQVQQMQLPISAELPKGSYTLQSGGACSAGFQVKEVRAGPPLHIAQQGIESATIFYCIPVTEE